MANSVGPKQTAVCSGSTLFASILKSSLMLSNYLQQTTSADDIFRFLFFFLALFWFVTLTVVEDLSGAYWEYWLSVV